MIHIGICDDNKYYVKIIHQFLTKSFMNTQLEYQVHEYTSSQAFLNGYHDYLFDIVLLDIEIDEKNGLTISQILQDSDKSPIIIFITSHHSFMKEAFGSNVYKYILKDEIEQTLPCLISSIIKKFSQHSLAFTSEEGTAVFTYKDIEYFEYNERKIFIKYKNQYIQVYISSLKKVLELINNSDFIQVNNRYIINLNYVQLMKEGLIVMDGINIDVPKGKRKLIYQNYQKFILSKYKNV